MTIFKAICRPKESPDDVSFRIEIDAAASGVAMKHAENYAKKKGIALSGCNIEIVKAG